MRVKICGITRQEDALLAEQVGAWAIGFIFAENTPRYISPEKACEIAQGLSGQSELVGVFLNSSVDNVVKTVNIAGLSKIQLHGEENPEFCQKVGKVTGKKVIKAIKIKDKTDLLQIHRYKNSVSYILLDTYSESQAGGTGKTFDWDIAQKAKDYGLPLILAGGINPDNARRAYDSVKPFALDVSSGVEKTAGIKDKTKIEKLGTYMN